MLWLSPLHAQQLLDRVVARVNNVPITLTDVNAALGLGIVVQAASGDPQASATVQLIDRQLMLAEVMRFAPPEPDPAAVDEEAARLKARAGDRLPVLMKSTGLDEERLRDLARDTLRIEAYLDQRFGTTVQVGEDEVERYYRTHPDEFTRNGALIPLEEAEPIARTRAAAARRAALIGQWLRDLRTRADVVMPGSR